jgi:tetratricopeptide (TPR) repeat protein
VVQAGGYISKHRALGRYLSLYKQNKVQLLSTRPIQSHDDYAESVYTTWIISFKCLSKLAATFLQLCSFLHHEGISEAIFSNAVSYKIDALEPREEDVKGAREFLAHFLTNAGVWDSVCFDHMIAEIQAYSLINRDPYANIFSIHPLVHDWSRNTVTNVANAQECIAAVVAMSGMVENHVLRIRLLPHLQFLLQGQPLLANKFSAEYGTVYWNSGYFDMAMKLQQGLLDRTIQILGRGHLHSLKAMHLLAITYISLGKYTDAEELQVAVLERRKQILGPEHLNTLMAMNNLAATYWNLAKYTDAEEIIVVVLERWKHLLGSDHPHTLMGMANLAGIYRSLGKLTDAEELEVVVLERRKQILGTEHVDTMQAMGHLANTYRGLGKFTDAEELQLVVLERWKQTLGAEHPDTLGAMGSLALTYQSLGKFTSAEELEVVVLEKRKQILGTEHPDTLKAMGNLALTYRSLGKLTDAEELEVVVLERKK